MKQREDRDELLSAARKEIEDNEKTLSMDIKGKFNCFTLIKSILNDTSVSVG